jgi:hypothetical protein
MNRELLRALPSVDEIAMALEGRFPHALTVSEARRTLGECRERIRRGDAVGDPVALVAAELDALRAPSRPEWCFTRISVALL